MTLKALTKEDIEEILKPNPIKILSLISNDGYDGGITETHLFSSNDLNEDFRKRYEVAILSLRDEVEEALYSINPPLTEEYFIKGELGLSKRYTTKGLVFKRTKREEHFNKTIKKYSNVLINIKTLDDYDKLSFGCNSTEVVIQEIDVVKII